jgi:hypothetical protein
VKREAGFVHLHKAGQGRAVRVGHRLPELSRQELVR